MRVEALQRYGILDTPNEPMFDRITRIAAHLFRVPVALLNFVDGRHCWLKSRYGLDIEQAPAEDTLCAHVVCSGQSLVVPDARADPRFVHLPVVRKSPGVRFYAGVPLRTPEGCPLGTLCVIDWQPRATFSDRERELLKDLADMVMHELDARLAAHRLAREVAERRQVEAALERARAEAVRANRAKSRFLATASHDLRQPFQAMQLFLHLLMGRLTDPGQIELANRIREAVEAGEGLLNGLLDISMLEAGRVKPNIV